MRWTASQSGGAAIAEAQHQDSPSPPRHVLVVAFHYPPEASSTGVLRTLKYTRYLPQYHWRSTVLAPTVSAYEVTDPKLAEQIPASTRVIRTRYLNTKRHFSIAKRYPASLAVPDNWIGWYPWAVSAGKRILQEDPPALIYSTSPHPTAHLIARRLARRSGIPWVVDFRDPWYEEPPEPGTPWIVHRAARYLEAWVIRAADRVVATTPQHAATLARRYPDQPDTKFSAIRNGYDEADFRSLEPIRQGTRHARMVILHAGTINAAYRRDPRPLLRALEELAKEGRVPLSEVEVQLLGPGVQGFAQELRGSLESTPLKDSLRFLPRVGYGDSLSLMAKADLLLLLEASDDTREMVPAKLYEYLRAGRPVLALCYEGAMAELIAETDGGWAIDPRDSAVLKDQLAEIYRLWRCGELGKKGAGVQQVKRYSRERLTGDLAHIFAEVLQHRGALAR